MSHIEALESRQFLSAVPVKPAPPHVVISAATTHPVKKVSFIGTYSGKIKSDFGKTTSILVITKETKSSIVLTLELYGETYSGTFKGDVIPGKQFDVKKSFHGVSLKFKGYLSPDGKEFKGRVKSGFSFFNDEIKLDLKRLL